MNKFKKYFTVFMFIFVLTVTPTAAYASNNNHTDIENLILLLLLSGPAFYAFVSLKYSGGDKHHEYYKNGDYKTIKIGGKEELFKTYKKESNPPNFAEYIPINAEKLDISKKNDIIKSLITKSFN